MPRECCPTCGRQIAAPKKTPAQTAVDLTVLSTADLMAHYKKTAPLEDVRFALRVGVRMSPQLRDDWQALLGLAPTLPRPETYRRLSALQARWRHERRAGDRRAWRHGDYLIAVKAKREYIRGALDPRRLVA